MPMEDWVKRLDMFLEFTGFPAQTIQHEIYHCEKS